MTGSSAGMLKGIKVVELAAEPGARYCGRLLATMGARVVRVGRHMAAPVAAFDAWLDERKEQAPSLDAALAELGGRCDLVIAGQMPAEVAEADALIASRKLDVVRAGLTWFGMTGPYANWNGDDALIQSLTGMAHLFGPAEGPPTLPQGPAPQLIGGAVLYIAAMGALWARRGGADGPRRVDTSILEAGLCLYEVAVAAQHVLPTPSVRSGINRYAVNHPFTVFATADGWIGINALTPSQWAGLATLIGKPEWAKDERFASSATRYLHADIIDAELNRVLPTRTSMEWLLDGQKLRVPLAPVPKPSELPELEHWVERGSFAPLLSEPKVKGPHLPFRASFDGHTKPVAKAAGPKPLSGVRVIDFTMGWAGPMAVRHLADLGADVIKIESYSHIDWWRAWEPQAQSDPPMHECMPNFNAMNRNKRGIAIDLATPEGVAKAKELIATADIVVENYAAGVMQKLGLGPEVLQTLRPGLVQVTMGAFGAIGPWSHFRAYGSTVEHSSGFPHVNGHAEWPPCLQHVAYGDPLAGIFGAVAALSGLHARDKLGGSWIDLSQVEALFQLNAAAIVASQIEGDPPRMGSRSPHAAPRCVVPARDPDDAVAVVVTDNESWRALCNVLGRDDWAMDGSLDTVAARNARAYEIEAALRAWARTLSGAEAAAELQEEGVAAAPVVPVHALNREPHLMEAGVWTFLDRRYVGLHLMSAAPYVYDGARLVLERPAPIVGEHTDEVLAELLQMQATSPRAAAE